MKHLGIDCKVILNGRTRNKRQDQTEFIWLRIESNGGL